MCLMVANGTPAGTELEAARLLLERLGVKPEQLIPATGADAVPVPTFADYVPRVSEAVTAGTRRVYETYWRRVVLVWGNRRLDEPTASEIGQLAETTKQHAVERGNSRGGRTAAEHLISALRCVYKFAIADGFLAEDANPALRVPKPRRLASPRRALPDAQLVEIVAVAGGTGNDPDLDALLIRLHMETACRRGGALALRRCDLDEAHCLIRLREKGETTRWQPVSPTLMRSLAAHHDARGGSGSRDQLLRYANGRPLTSRRYDHLWQRLGKHLPWIAAQQITTHWLRHTTLTWVERNFSFAVARAYAGHDGKNDVGTTGTYVRADLYEIARALAALTGERHPLIEPGATWATRSVSSREFDGRGPSS
jgi:integrase